MDNVETQVMPSGLPEQPAIPPSQPDSPVEFKDNEVEKGLFDKDTQVGPCSIGFLHSLVVFDGVTEEFKVNRRISEYSYNLILNMLHTCIDVHACLHVHWLRTCRFESTSPHLL